LSKFLAGISNQFDFILASGDDKTDELLFQAMPDNAYTVRVGLSPSFAKYNVPDFSILLNLLKTLSE
jgi:trehalose 6-phosphate synthase/phosphatase